MQLLATPDNPIPRQPVLMSVVTQDGVTLRVARWRPTTRAVRGTVCILQGRAEFIEKYFEVVRDLRRRGFAVVAFDWRGQGRSGRETSDPRKGYVRSFSRYRRDLEAVQAQVLEPHMPQPHFALAHSTGAAVALLGAYQGWLPFRRLVATSPLLGLTLVPRPRLAAAVVRTLTLLGFGHSFVPGGGATSISTKPFAGNRLTSDPVRYARNAEVAAALGEGAVGDPTLAWVNAAFRCIKTLADPRVPLAIRIPTLIIAAGADPVCSTPACERFAARLKAGHAIVLPGARHEILMERDDIRETFWAAFDAFIPGSADPEFGGEPDLGEGEAGAAGPGESASQQLDGGRVDAPVARRNDGASLGG